jgi:hypothetical protein
VLPAGVGLEARVAGASTFVRPALATGDWVAVTASGGVGGTIAGLRFVSTAERPLYAGVRVQGQGRALRLLEFDGVMEAGIDLDTGAAITLRGSHFSVRAPAVAMADDSRLEAAGNVFVKAESNLPLADQRPGAMPSPALALGARTQLALDRNVFVGFGPMPVAGLADEEWEPLRAGNVVVSADLIPVR